MSLFEQNRMLHILYRNGVGRKNIKTIMADLTTTDIFTEELEDEFDDESWRLLEEEAMILFSNKARREKVKEIKILKKKQKEYEKHKMTQYDIEQESRVLKKREELIKKGVIDPDAKDPFEDEKKDTKTSIRYGRTPLHEAISMKDIKVVKKYLQSGQFLDVLDNNGHTPLEVAFYEDYTEALILFDHYRKKKKVG